MAEIRTKRYNAYLSFKLWLGPQTFEELSSLLPVSTLPLVLNQEIRKIENTKQITVIIVENLFVKHVICLVFFILFYVSVPQ